MWSKTLQTIALLTKSLFRCVYIVRITHTHIHIATQILLAENCFLNMCYIVVAALVIMLIPCNEYRKGIIILLHYNSFVNIIDYNLLYYRVLFIQPTVRSVSLYL